jgi:hypothetical protein
VSPHNLIQAIKFVLALFLLFLVVRRTRARSPWPSRPARDGGRDRRGVDWTPVVEDVRALLDGSNLFVLDALIRALVESGVDRRWAVPFLAGGGHAVLARMAAADRRMWMPAHALLVALRGQDLGRDPAEWVRWAASLEH